MLSKDTRSLKKLSREEWIYLLKCLIGAAVCFTIFTAFPAYPLYWSLISVVLVFTPDNSNQLAYDRIKSNFLGAGIGMLLFFLPLPELVLLLTGIAVTVLVGFALGFEKTLRPALAALIIVLLEAKGESHWLIPVERVLCVSLGCVVALFITYVFSLGHKVWRKA